jgi:hypothetical protein
VLGWLAQQKGLPIYSCKKILILDKTLNPKPSSLPLLCLVDEFLSIHSLQMLSTFFDVKVSQTCLIWIIDKKHLRVFVSWFVHHWGTDQACSTIYWETAKLNLINPSHYNSHTPPKVAPGLNYVKCIK